MTYLLKTPAYLIFEEVQNSDIMTISQKEAEIVSNYFTIEPRFIGGYNLLKYLL